MKTPTTAADPLNAQALPFVERHRSRHAAARAGARLQEKHKYGNVSDLLELSVPALCTIIVILGAVFMN